ncbi:MAG: glycoside hydrolase family 5 protein [Actinomycetes bacterium]
MTQQPRATGRAIAVAVAAVLAIGLAAIFTGSHNAGPSAALVGPRLNNPATPPRIVPYTPASPTPAITQPPTPGTTTPGRTPRRAQSASPYRHVRWTFDTGPSGWAAGAGDRVDEARSPVLAGRGSLALRNTDATARPVATNSAAVPARPGMHVLVAVAIRAAQTARDVNVVVVFANSRGEQVDSATSQTMRETSTHWGQSFTAVGLAPPGTAYAVLQLIVQNAGPGETQYVDNATLDEYPGGSAAVAGPLHTSGNRVVDAHGRTVVLRGFTRAGLEGADAAPPTADDIGHAKAWGATVIRLPLNDQFWLSSSCAYRSEYTAEVDHAVDVVTRLGMVAMLDLHWNSFTPCGRVGPQPMADYPGALTFWQQVAARYGNNPLVAFDLYNEPHDISDQVWRWGGQIRWRGAQVAVAGMQQMYDAVRSSGAASLVFVSGNGWGARWPTGGPLKGINIVYGVHAYACPQQPPPNCDNASPYDPSPFFSAWSGASRSVPVAVTEFGWPDPSDGRYLAAVIAYAKAHGWGWTAYTWGNATWGEFSLLATAGLGTNYQPQPGGAAVLAGLTRR